jgi:subtilase family serine protease
VVSGNETEAELDAEWASAAAPSAAIILASCQDTTTTFGGLIAIQNLVNASSPPAILSLSFGECEPENGASGNAAVNSIYQQAVSEGISVFVSTGDEGAASCDADKSTATHGIAVNAFASTQYNVAVGGTDFGDTFAGTNATYWSTSNSSTFESALSYVAEIPWNDSCASSLIATFEGFNASFGSCGFCNSSTGSNFITTASGSGSPSTWSRAGGTSFSTPILAGIQALVNQSTGERQGNPNVVYYALATSQYASSLACISTSGSNGVLSTSTTAFASAYPAGSGWDFATGLGTINAANLVSFWSSSDLSLGGSASINASGAANGPGRA